MTGSMSEIAHLTAAPAASVQRRPRHARRLRFALLMLVCLATPALLAGFVDFAERVAGAAPPFDPHAEGIVVLTGGTARIDGALQLLAEGRANRLLISGVNPMVTRQALASTVDNGLRRVLDCCVDLDHQAQDTIGNAAETREWADGRGFSSLIVVTSDYHMPRSMAELALAMPKKRLIAFPVNNPELHLTNWWRDPGTFSLLVREYGKYLVAETRRMVSPDTPANTPVAASLTSARP
jgi:uncharacterized SAM-binding protein YcdF (DUF218 family)